MATITRTPEAEALDVILVGSFNPAIFHPEWFFRQGLIGDQDVKDAKVDDVSAELTRVQLCGLHLSCVSDRLHLGTSNISGAERLQDLIVGTFRKLPHTPVTACGINSSAHYSVHSIKYWNQIGHELAPKERVWSGFLDEPGMQLLTIKAPRRGNFPGEINVSVEPSMLFRPGIFVKANYHYGLPPGTLHDGAADQVLRFLESEWKEAAGMARKAANEIFSKITPSNE